VFNLGITFDVSSPQIPLIFVLSPGVDPRNMLQQLAVQKNMTERFRTLALGQGQGILNLKNPGIKAGKKAGKRREKRRE
jgi:dynein heavy chain